MKLYGLSLLLWQMVAATIALDLNAGGGPAMPCLYLSHINGLLVFDQMANLTRDVQLFYPLKLAVDPLYEVLYIKTILEIDRWLSNLWLQFIH